MYVWHAVIIILNYLKEITMTWSHL